MANTDIMPIKSRILNFYLSNKCAWVMDLGKAWSKRHILEQ